MTEERCESLALITEAVDAGCRVEMACKEVGVDPRTVQRWRRAPEGGQDARRGPNTAPSHALTAAERAAVVDAANTPEFRNLSPKQIVPRLADRGEYIASESTFYRVLREADQLAPRGAAKPRTNKRPEEVIATGPKQVWSWDITYLPSPIRGRFFYLYLFVDVWSRRIVKAVVHENESAELAAISLDEACLEENIPADTLTVHADNGGPMKGATMLATMQALGIVPSFSRPSVSDDNPYSEALFRTLKYVPSYPRKPFASRDAAWAWVERFVAWYNGEHRHSAIGFVTPDERHRGDDIDVLEARRRVYAVARARTPSRWSRGIRAWNAPAEVALNPRDRSTSARAASPLRCGVDSTTSMAPPQAPKPARTPPRRHAREGVAA
ncbi:MAG: IS3 family transposase [Deltaproteobacteria bacterium]